MWLGATPTIVIPAAPTSPPGTVNRNENAPLPPTDVSPSTAPISRSSSSWTRSYSIASSEITSPKADLDRPAPGEQALRVGLPQRDRVVVHVGILPRRCVAGEGVALRPLGAPGGRSGRRRTGRRRSATRSTMVRIVQRSGRRSGSSSSSQAIGRGDRRAGGRPDGVRRDERLDRRVLGVVEAGAALARLLRPLPGHEVRDGRPDRPRDPLDPGARLGERRSAARSGSRPGCRACRSSSG